MAARGWDGASLDVEETLRQAVLAGLAQRKESARWDRLAAALNRAFRAPGAVSDEEWPVSWAKLERRAKAIGTRPKGFHAPGQPVSAEFKAAVYERYQQQRRAYYEARAAAGNATVFNSMQGSSPITKRLFGL